MVVVVFRQRDVGGFAQLVIAASGIQLNWRRAAPTSEVATTPRASQRKGFSLFDFAEMSRIEVFFMERICLAFTFVLDALLPVRTMRMFSQTRVRSGAVGTFL